MERTRRTRTAALTATAEAILDLIANAASLTLSLQDTPRNLLISTAVAIPIAATAATARTNQDHMILDSKYKTNIYFLFKYIKNI
jgi:hypothetical protein